VNRHMLGLHHKGHGGMKGEVHEVHAKADAGKHIIPAGFPVLSLLYTRVIFCSESNMSHTGMCVGWGRCVRVCAC
jgi:hypothetical protein